jgi:hypothetical protein
MPRARATSMMSTRARTGCRLFRSGFMRRPPSVPQRPPWKGRQPRRKTTADLHYLMHPGGKGVITSEGDMS